MFQSHRQAAFQTEKNGNGSKVATKKNLRFSCCGRMVNRIENWMKQNETERHYFIQVLKLNRFVMEFLKNFVSGDAGHWLSKNHKLRFPKQISTITPILHWTQCHLANIKKKIGIFNEFVCKVFKITKCTASWICFLTSFQWFQWNQNSSSLWLAF